MLITRASARRRAPGRRMRLPLHEASRHKKPRPDFRLWGRASPLGVSGSTAFPECAIATLGIPTMEHHRWPSVGRAGRCLLPSRRIWPRNAWCDVAQLAKWTSPADVKDQFRSASVVGSNRVVFNIKGMTAG
jgi:hypothetical protein